MSVAADPRPASEAERESVPDPLIGTRLGGRYLIERIHSRGGMSIVYAALHERHECEVAIKVLADTAAADPEAVERFLLEAETASSLSHGNVVAVSDFGQLPDGRPYLVMPMLAGTDLATLLAQQGPQHPRRVAALLAGVASALDAMHEKGLVHRDIKSENLMHIQGEDGTERVLVLDFGIAAARAGLGKPWSEDGSGTPEFMPPEALIGDLPDQRGDVYALATVAFELMTGRLPFDGEDLSQLLRNKITRNARSLWHASSVRFPEALETVIAHALAQRPEERPASAGEFASALQEAAARMPKDAAVPNGSRTASARYRTLTGPGRALRAGPALSAQALTGERMARNTRRGWNPEAESTAVRVKPVEPPPQAVAADEAESTAIRVKPVEALPTVAPAKPKPSRKQTIKSQLPPPVVAPPPRVSPPEPAPELTLEAAVLQSVEPALGATPLEPAQFKRPRGARLHAPPAAAEAGEDVMVDVTVDPAGVEAPRPPELGADTGAAIAAAPPPPLGGLPALTDESIRPPPDLAIAEHPMTLSPVRSGRWIAGVAAAALIGLAFVVFGGSEPSRSTPPTPAPAATPAVSATSRAPAPKLSPTRLEPAPVARVQPNQTAATPPAQPAAATTTLSKPAPKPARVPKPKRSAPAAKSSPKRSEPAAAPERPAKARAEEPRAKGDSASAAQLTQTATDAMLRGDFATARVQYEKAIQADRGHAPAWRGRGLVLERMGRTQDAIKSFRRYLKLSPDAPGADKIRARLQSLEAAQ